MTTAEKTQTDSTGTAESYYGEPFDEEGVLNYARWLPHAPESRPTSVGVPQTVTLHHHHHGGDPLLDEAIKFNAKCEAAMSKQTEERRPTKSDPAEPYEIDYVAY